MEHNGPIVASPYRPAGKAIYFCTVTTDAFQGLSMANYFTDTLKERASMAWMTTPAEMHRPG